MPIPINAMVCVRRPSVTVSAPARVPVAEGANDTLKAHTVCAATEAPHPLLTWKSPLYLPGCGPAHGHDHATTLWLGIELKPDVVDLEDNQMSMRRQR